VSQLFVLLRVFASSRDKLFRHVYTGKPLIDDPAARGALPGLVLISGKTPSDNVKLVNFVVPGVDHMDPAGDTGVK
jgi:hypothetical protein